MRVGVVVIGRNEATALTRCLGSVLDRHPALVYVDSSSTDGSPAIAEYLGAHVVRLGAEPPISAARGRNTGREWFRERYPKLDYIQFLDGDTELESGWVERATAFLDQNRDVGVVAGRLRERFPERNIYHRLADIEFDTPHGDVDAVGGIAMYRIASFDQAGGFDARVISGEERELCRRIAALGTRIVRLPETMARHDIDMDRFGEWWRRTKRSGQTAAEHFADRGIMGRDVASMLMWGAALPALSLGLALPTFGGSIVCVCGAYTVLFERVRRNWLTRGGLPSDAALHAAAIVLGKVPEAAGVLDLARRRLMNP